MDPANNEIKTTARQRRVKRKRKLVDGHLVMLKNPASAKNGKTRKVFPMYGHGDGPRHWKLDGRHPLARSEKKIGKALRANWPRELTVMDNILIAAIARLDSLSRMAQVHVSRSGQIDAQVMNAISRINADLLVYAESDAFKTQPLPVDEVLQRHATREWLHEHHAEILSKHGTLCPRCIYEQEHREQEQPEPPLLLPAARYQRPVVRRPTRHQRDAEAETGQPSKVLEGDHLPAPQPPKPGPGGEPGARSWRPADVPTPSNELAEWQRDSGSPWRIFRR